MIGCVIYGGAHDSGCCIPTKDTTHEVNYMGNQPRPNFNAGGYSGFQHDQQYNQQQGQWRTHPDQGGPSNRPQQQRPSLYDRTTKLEETLAQFMKVSMSNQKSTESAIKNLEVQVGQLSKQLADRPSSSFGANIEKNPKEECKAVMIRSKMVSMNEDEKRIGEEKQQLVIELEIDPVVEPLSETEEDVEVEDDQQKEIPIIVSEKEIKKEREKENENEKNEKNEKEKERKEEKKKSKSECAREKKIEASPAEGREVPYPLVPSRKDKERHLARFLDIFKKLEITMPFGEALQFAKRMAPHKRKGIASLSQARSIYVVVVKEFYANLYVPEDKAPKQVRVQGHLIMFNADSLNTFLKTQVVLEQGESLPSYSRFCRLRPDPQELAVWMCIPGRGFVLNTEGLPWKLLRKDLTTLVQTWSPQLYIPLNLDRARLVYGLVMMMNMNIGALISGQISFIAQSSSSRLGFPALITALCKARGVTSDSLTYESLSPAINLAYIKNSWNLDDPSVTFPGTQKSRARRSEAPSPSAAPAPSTSALPSAPAAPVLPEPAPGPAPNYVELAGCGPTTTSYERGGVSTEGDEASTAQEPQSDQEDDSSEATPTSPEPFIFEDDPVTTKVTQQASPTSTPALDLNEEAMD
ncbi:hypothetical protein HKD37_09G025535 [Glycine soja]